MYYAQPSWYIRTTSIKDALLRENAATDWHPESIKEGRYGDWLNNNVDWALSRNRYCVLFLSGAARTNMKSVRLAKGARRRAKSDHRPFVDEIALTR